jgi:hypothetical protein
MKSWGERLVTGLKNWRSRKGEAAPEQTPDAGLREQLNPESIEQSSIGAVGFDPTSLPPHPGLNRLQNNPQREH